MPKRTNDFQELVSLIQQALLPDGAKVTESAMVKTTDGASEREIDILIDSAIGPYRIRVAVEAKKESRKMDLARFDAIVGKYLSDGGVRVNKVVVVAHNGFTPDTITRARLLDIELVTLSEAKSTDWSRLKPPHLCLQSAIELIETEFDEEVRTAFGNSIPSDAQIVCSCGWQHGPPSSYARHSFLRTVLRDRRPELLKSDEEVIAQGVEKKFQITINPVEPHQIFLEYRGVRVIVKTFSFKVRLFKPPPTPEPPAGQIKMSHAPHVCGVLFTPEIKGIDHRTLLDKSNVKCACCDKDHGTVRQWTSKIAITNFLNRNGEAQKLLADGLCKSPTGNAHLITDWPVPSNIRVAVEGVEHAPQSMKIDIHAVTANGKMEHKQFEMRRSDGTASIVDSFEGIVGGKRLRMIMPDGLSSKRIVLRVDSAKPTKPNKPKSKLLANRRRMDERKNRGKRRNGE